MKLNKYLIAGGNSTLIVWDCPESEKSGVIKKYLGQVEQIGFASIDKDGVPMFSMMGGEFCGNGTIAFASTLSEKGQLRTSGINDLVDYNNSDGNTTITVPIRYSIDNNIVLLVGIGYLYSDKDIDVKPELLKSLAQKYNLPAFGVACNIGGKLIPYVYVRDTDSFFKETACGSGSIAVCIMSGLEQIIQPSGKVIAVKKNGDQFQLTAKVTKI